MNRKQFVQLAGIGTASVALGEIAGCTNKEPGKSSTPHQQMTNLQELIKQCLFPTVKTAFNRS
jgi:hypothetical protein